MRTIKRNSEPMIAVQIRDQIISGYKSLDALANDYHINTSHLEHTDGYLSANIFGLSDFEKYIIIRIYKMTKLPPEELYHGLRNFIPNLTVGNIHDCIKLSKRRKA